MIAMAMTSLISGTTLIRPRSSSGGSRKMDDVLMSPPYTEVLTATPDEPQSHGTECVRPGSHATSIHSGAMLAWLGRRDRSNSCARPSST
jgi:hypothetical protein